MYVDPQSHADELKTPIWEASAEEGGGGPQPP